MLMPKDAILFKIVHTCAKDCFILKYKYIQNPWYHHFWVYDNVSRLFSIDFFFSKMTNFKEKNQEIKVLISAHLT